MAGLLVIGYDGSLDAKHASDAAISLHADTALVVNVWQPALGPTETALPLGVGAMPAPVADERVESEARRLADDGVARARQIGLAADAVVVRGTSVADVGRTLATLAEERGATAIVVGRRGISRLEAAVLGSVSNDTVRTAQRPIVVVPAPTD